MFGYMTDLSTVEETGAESIEAEGNPYYYFHFQFNFAPYSGHDLESLLYKFLDEFLFLFSAEPFFIPKVNII